MCSVTKGLRTSEADTLFARRVDVDIPFGEPMDEAKLKQMAEDESEREIPVVDHTDVVVCGGGPAGVLRGYFFRQDRRRARRTRVPEGKNYAYV